MAVTEFRFLKRHYDMLSDQVLKNHPNETGGFLGGKEGAIQLVLPAFNQVMENKQARFGIQSEDIHRAHELCAKYGMKYYGMYHNHPSGVNRPSFQDMNHVQRYLFILTLNHRNVLKITAYRAAGRQPIPVPVVVVASMGVEPSARSDQPTGVYEELDYLNNQLHGLRNQSLQYPRYDADDRSSGTTFNTLA
jgi:proteasome lid subunit RPN8/RPN11